MPSLCLTRLDYQTCENGGRDLTSHFDLQIKCIILAGDSSVESVQLNHWNRDRPYLNRLSGELKFEGAAAADRQERYGFLKECKK